MSTQASIEDSPAGPPAGPDGSTGALRVFGLAAVCIGVAALAAATFVLSYAGIRAVALQAGIEPRYAKGYPLLIDAMLVIVIAAVLALRGAGLPSRILAWLMLLVVLAAAAGADALHATRHTLPHNAAAITAAALPWTLVFFAFVLLLSMLRHARLRVQASRALRPAAQGIGHYAAARPVPPLPVRTPRSPDSASIVPGMTSQLVSSAAAGAAAAATSPTATDDRHGDQDGDDDGWMYDVDDAEPPTDGYSLLTADRMEGAGASGPDADPGTQPGESRAQAHDGETGGPGVSPERGEPAPDAAEADPDTGKADAWPDTAGTDSAAAEAGPDTEQADAQADTADPEPAEPAEDDMPVFHRMWSAPTPPGT